MYIVYIVVLESALLGAWGIFWNIPVAVLTENKVVSTPCHLQTGFDF